MSTCKILNIIIQSIFVKMMHDELTRDDLTEATCMRSITMMINKDLTVVNVYTKYTVFTRYAG